FDDVVAEPLVDRDDDLRGGVDLVVLLGDQLLVARDARLGLGLAGLRRGGDPLLLTGDRALADHVLAALLLQALLLLHQPGRVVALVGDALAAIELEYPAGD